MGEWLYPRGAWARDGAESDERERESNIGSREQPGGTSGKADEPERFCIQRNIFTILLITKCDSFDGDVD